MSILITDLDKVETIPTKSGINLIGQDTSSGLSLYPTYHESVFVITSKEPINTIIRVEEGTNAYNSIDTLFIDITSKYKEESQYTKEFYEKINFVDIYNNVITLFSDSSPLEESSAFIIKKYMKENGNYFELCYYYNKCNKLIELYDQAGGGNYYPYYHFFMDLYRNLACDLNNTNTKDYSKIKN